MPELPFALPDLFSARLAVGHSRIHGDHKLNHFARSVRIGMGKLSIIFYGLVPENDAVMVVVVFGGVVPVKAHFFETLDYEDTRSHRGEHSM